MDYLPVEGMDPAEPKRCIQCKGMHVASSMFVMKCQHFICTHCSVEMRGRKCLIHGVQEILHRANGTSKKVEQQDGNTAPESIIKKVSDSLLSQYQNMFNLHSDSVDANQASVSALEDKCDTMQIKYDDAQYQARKLQGELDALRLVLQTNQLSIDQNQFTQVDTARSSLMPQNSENPEIQMQPNTSCIDNADVDMTP